MGPITVLRDTQPLPLLDACKWTRLAGEPHTVNLNAYLSADGSKIMGTWICTPGKFEVNYDKWEFCHFLDGYCIITPEGEEPKHLKAGDVFVIAHDSATVWTGIPDLYSKFLQFNGDDALVLYKLSTSSAVDIFGSIGNDPGSAWMDTVAASATYKYRTENSTLVRKPCVYSGITVNPDLAGIYGFPTLFTEWDTLAVNDVTGLGSHTMGAATYNFSVAGDAVVTGTGNCRNIQIGSQNSVITVTGTFYGFNTCGGSTTIAVNLDENCPKVRPGITTSAVEGSSIELYPNPTNGSAMLTFTTNSDENVSVVLYDISGKQRMILNEGFLVKGTHRLEADLSKLAAGTYLIKITSATENNTLRVIKTDK